MVDPNVTFSQGRKEGLLFLKNAGKYPSGDKMPL